MRLTVAVNINKKLINIIGWNINICQNKPYRLLISHRVLPTFANPKFPYNFALSAKP